MTIVETTMNDWVAAEAPASVDGRRFYPDDCRFIPLSQQED